MWTLGRLDDRNRDPAPINEKRWMTGHPEEPGDHQGAQ